MDRRIKNLTTSELTVRRLWLIHRPAQPELSIGKGWHGVILVSWTLSEDAHVADTAPRCQVSGDTTPVKRILLSSDRGDPVK
jgi:hypothetical protein